MQANAFLGKQRLLLWVIGSVSKGEVEIELRIHVYAVGFVDSGVMSHVKPQQRHLNESSLSEEFVQLAHAVLG